MVKIAIAVPSAVCAALLAAGCTHPGAPAADTPTQPAAAPVVTDFLPTDAELSKALDTTMITRMPATSGVGTLHTGTYDASPVDCLTVTMSGLAYAYRDTQVGDAGNGDWATVNPPDGFADPAYAVEATVVRLDSAASARRWFSAATGQWQRCRGTSVSQPSNLTGPTAPRTESNRITAVAGSADLLNAVVLSTLGDDPRVLRIQRAVTVAAEYIVDVQVTESSPAHGAAPTAEQANAVATMIAGKIVARD